MRLSPSSSALPGPLFLRLGTPGLPAADSALIRTLCQLHRHRGKANWSLVDAPPYDAVVCDMQAAAPLHGAAAVLSLVPPGMAAEESENIQPRPLRSERFFHWLEAAERSLIERRQTPEALERQHPSPAAGPGEIRFKLRRWPAVALLRNDPHRVRMAALLARRPMTPTELANLLDAGAPENLTFLRVLQACALLETTAPLHVAHDEPRGTFAADRSASGGYARMAQGVIHGIRRRLGL